MKTVNKTSCDIRWQMPNMLQDLNDADDLCLLSNTISDMQEKLNTLDTGIS